MNETKRSLQKEIGQLYLQFGTNCREQADVLSLEELDEIKENLYKKIDELNRLESDNEETTKRCVLMKAHVRLLSASHHLVYEDNVDCCETLTMINRMMGKDFYLKELVGVLQAIDPYKNDPCAAYFYVTILDAMAFYHVEADGLDKKIGLEYGLFAEKRFYRFKLTNETPKYFCDLIDLPELAQEEEDNFDSLLKRISFTVWKAYYMLLNFEALIKYIPDALACALSRIIPHHLFLGCNLQMFTVIPEMLECLLKARLFKQLDHALGLAWGVAYNHRGAMDETARVPLLNHFQGMLSHIFAQWGLDILEATLQAATGENYEPINNDVYAKIDYPTTPEIESYYGQFPIEPISRNDGKKIKRYLNRAKKWRDRSFELFSYKPIYPDDVEIPPYDEVHEVGKELEKVEEKFLELGIIFKN